MTELAKTARTNPLLNDTPFKSEMLGGEVTVSGSGSSYDHHFTDSRNNLEYDIQYVQVGWSLTKAYGEGAANMVMSGYMLLPATQQGIQSIEKLFGKNSGEENHLNYYKKENLAANMRGLQLGEFGAKRFVRNKMIKTLKIIGYV